MERKAHRERQNFIHEKDRTAEHLDCAVSILCNKVGLADEWHKVKWIQTKWYEATKHVW